MTRGVRWYLVSSLVLVALVAVAGCSHYMLAEREPWRHEAELACLNSGAVNDTAGRVRIAAIEGPGACGIDYPLRVSALGESAPLSYDDEPVPPGAIPNGVDAADVDAAELAGSAARRFSRARCRRCKPVRRNPIRHAQPYPAPQPYPPPQSYPHAAPAAPQPRKSASRCRSIRRRRPPRRRPRHSGRPAASLLRRSERAALFAGATGKSPVPPLGPPHARWSPLPRCRCRCEPPATLACPIMSALDQWIAGAVQPAAAHWFRQPVVEIKQISAYSCRGMNGNPNAHISEHAFGNALDVAEFDLADGHKISVQYGWHGTPEEQGFLHDVQAAACDQFTTVLAPGANVYHYNHIHVDLMRHYNGRHICEPARDPGRSRRRAGALAIRRAALRRAPMAPAHRLDQDRARTAAQLFRRGRRQSAGSGAGRRLSACHRPRMRSMTISAASAAPA